MPPHTAGAEAPGAYASQGPDPLWRAAASYERLQAIFQLAPTGIGVVDLDGRTILTNDALREMLGYGAEEFATLHWEAFTHPADIARNEELFSELVAGHLDRFQMHKRFFHKDGSIIWGQLTVSLLRDDDGQPSLAIGMLENITERRDLEEQLKDAEATYRLLVEQVPAVVYVADVDVDAPWQYVSPQIQRLLGFTPDEWLADLGLWARQIHPDDLDATLAACDDAIAADGSESYMIHYRMHRRDGSLIWVRDEFRVLHDADGRQVFRGVLLDITREKELEASLERQAFHDPLTHLANRDLFRDRIEHCLERTIREHDRYDAVVFVDLDDFKTVNDSLGHGAGDELICSVADRIRACLRPGDTAGRLGGDEFGILVEDVQHLEDALGVAQRLQQAIHRPHRLTDKTVVTSASLGVAYLRDADSASAVLRNADLAMYRAKELGKGRLATYEPMMHIAAVRRLDLRSALEGALARDELSVHLQPIVDVGTGWMIGAEALLRWTHPQFGNVPPDDFIPIAEETGAIGHIGEWVLRTACEWLASQHAAGARHLAVSVNVSPMQLEDDTFVAVVAACLQGTGLPARSLVLELTEQTLMSERSWTVLRQLKGLGVRIAMDDFGTGYASLAYLSELAVDVLKIDRQFVRQLAGDRKAQAVPQAVTSLARALDIQVVAEGVETEAQWQLLRQMGCAAAQGYLFGRPQSLSQIARFVGRPLGVTAAPASLTARA